LPAETHYFLFIEMIPQPRAGVRGDTRMKTPLVMVSATLTLAIVLVAGFLIASQARGQNAAEPQRVRCVATQLTTICGK
jgi:hypothetical protein